ncbi:MAG: AAA family ATPase [Actinomycetota bacterium]
MIIDFSVENFRSIRSEVTLSALEATRSPGKGRQGTGKRRIKTDDEIAQPYRVERLGIGILPVLAIFGANASGKSNLVRALDALLCLMGSCGPAVIRLQDLQPFRLGSDSSVAPTSFRIRFLAGDQVYCYTLVTDRQSIVHEELQHIPSDGVELRLLYRREYAASRKAGIFEVGPDFEGSHIQLLPSTRRSQPFLPLLVDQIELPVTEALSRWLTCYWSGGTLCDERADRAFMIRSVGNDDGSRSGLASKLREFDTGIDDVEVRRTDGGGDDYELFVVHTTPSGRVVWSIEEESHGTQNLVGLIPKLSVARGSGSIALIDELGANIHPGLIRRIVRDFQHPSASTKRGQLIFTSHDNTLQRNQLLRRDQIWFTQKREDGSTDLYPLTDFKVRNDLAIDRAYLDGRFRAVPVFSEEESAQPEGVSE